MSALQFDSRWLGLPLIAGVLSRARRRPCSSSADAPARPAPASASAALAPPASGAEAAPAAQRLRLTTVAALPAPPPRAVAPRASAPAHRRPAATAHAVPGRITRAGGDARAGGDRRCPRRRLRRPHPPCRRRRPRRRSTTPASGPGLRRARSRPVIAVRPPEVPTGPQLARRLGRARGLTAAAAVAGGVVGRSPRRRTSRPRRAPHRAPRGARDRRRAPHAPAGLGTGPPRFRLTGLDARRRHGGRRRGGGSRGPPARRPVAPSRRPGRACRACTRRLHRRVRGPAHGATSSPRRGRPTAMTVVVAPSTGGVVTLACLAPGDASDACADAARHAGARPRRLAARRAGGRRADRSSPRRSSGLTRAAAPRARSWRRRSARRAAAAPRLTSRPRTAPPPEPLPRSRPAAPPVCRRCCARWPPTTASSRAHTRAPSAAALRAGAAIERREQRLAALLDAARPRLTRAVPPHSPARRAAWRSPSSSACVRNAVIVASSSAVKRSARTACHSAATGPQISPARA